MASTPPDGTETETTTDPICGRVVPLTESALTLDYDGTTYAFCSRVCRDLFARQRHEVAIE
jgi:YHS domain-containing protein